MSATKVMLIAISLGVVGRWANNKKALPSPAGVLEIIGALFLISVLDNGKTEDVAKGFAWLFLVAVLLSDSSPLTGLAKAEKVDTGRIPNASGLPGTGGGPFPGATAARNTSTNARTP